ncbi:MAG: HAMP domain-containing histidine kinase [Saprospiraceae bacterium]|nr:HAMP domain-containing histidine kinase [Saprospiraceae bacterium]
MKKIRKNFFEKFFRVSTGDKHDVKGFGLGLFYVKNICRAHGWWISVDSELGKGTTFTIDIPEFKFKL